MLEKTNPDISELATALIDIIPRVLRRIGADLSNDSETADADPVWREVTELRATPGQLTLLRVLVEHKRCMMQELAEHLGVAPSTTTAMVKRLLAQGYIERSRDDVDWRSVWVKATERGQQAVTIFERARITSLQRRIGQLSDDERRLLEAALPALRHLIEEHA